MKRTKNLSLGEYFLHRYQTTDRPLRFSARTPAELEAWRPEFVGRLRECMAPFPEPVDLDPITVEVVDEGEYTREKVLYDSEDGMAVVANVLVPNDIGPDEQRPGVLACHGHGFGKEDVCGLAHGEHRRVASIEDHNYDYARQLALKGYVVVAPDWRGFGERKVGGEIGGKDICDALFDKGMLLGLNLLTLNVWDAMVSVGYLQSRPEVDSERIGCAGLSYGGTMTLFTTALDERIKCAVVSGYLNTFESFALSAGHFCGAQIPPGILQFGEASDVASSISPRPLLIEAGVKDLGVSDRRHPRGGRAHARGVRGRRCVRALRRRRVRRGTPLERRQGVRLDGTVVGRPEGIAER